MTAAARPLPGILRCAAFETAAAPGDGWQQEIPAPGVELVLELDTRWEVEVGGRRFSTGAFVGGPAAARIRTRARGPMRLVQVSLHPLAVPALLGVPAGELARQIVDLDAALGDEATRLLEQLDDAWRSGGPSAAASAGAWIERRALRPMPSGHARPSAPPDLIRALARLETTQQYLPTGTLATELGCSRRHLARRFEQWIGTTPTEHQRLRRLALATAALREHPTAGLAGVAADAGYADQSHMVRDFRALTDRTPGATARAFAVLAD
ncbi:MAG: helix-turn-helix domain-containing protein [Patulibacter minatonensis]